MANKSVPCGVVFSFCVVLMAVLPETCAQAERELFGGTYLVMGRARDATPVSRPSRPDWQGKWSPIMLARTPERSIAGHKYGTGFGSGLPEDAAEGRAYHYVARGLSHGVLIDAMSRTATELNDVTGVEMTWLIQQEPGVPPTLDGGIREIYPSIVSSCAESITFCRSRDGVFLSDVTKLVRSEAGGGVIRNQCGETRISVQNGKHVFEQFAQASDVSDFSVPNELVGDFRSSLFPNGVQSDESRSEFSTLIGDDLRAPWRVHSTSVEKGTGGEVIHSEYEVEVTEFRTDRTEVDAVIDRILGLIPEGTRIITNEKMNYMWKDKGIHIAVDRQALATAERLEFRQAGRSWSPLAMTTVGCLLVLGLVYGVQRWQRSR